jgi:O-methyltransferase involved in polyketide biosynthesis
MLKTWKFLVGVSITLTFALLSLSIVRVCHSKRAYYIIFHPPFARHMLTLETSSFMFLHRPSIGRAWHGRKGWRSTPDEDGVCVCVSERLPVSLVLARYRVWCGVAVVAPEKTR